MTPEFQAAVEAYVASGLARGTDILPFSTWLPETHKQLGTTQEQVSTDDVLSCFADNLASASGWERRTDHPWMMFRYRALAQDVLAVASLDLLGRKWGVYCKAVPGKQHEDEWCNVLNHGTLMAEDTARTLFWCPWFGYR